MLLFHNHFDFLNNIRPYAGDMKIMESWKRHFRRKKKVVPFFVTVEDVDFKHKHDKIRYKLWKEVEIEDRTTGGFVFEGEV